MTVLPDYIFIDDSTINLGTPENIVRDDMSNGMAKTRLINTIGLSNISFSVSIHKDYLKAFKNWFRADLQYGRLFFLMRDPIDGTMVKYRFLDANITWAKQGNILTSVFSLETYDE